MPETSVLQTNSLADRWLNRSGRIFMPVWLLLITAAISWGWSARSQDYLTPENGLGYWLGIIGGSMILLLLTYSLRKRLQSLSHLFSIKTWFQTHMVLGILGPLAILFHSNFNLGSLNSTVALVSMLLVAGSGLVGRYLYSRIHFGLYGEKIKLQQIRADFQLLRSDMCELCYTDKQKAMAVKLFGAIESLINLQIDDATSFSVRKSQESVQKISTALVRFSGQLENYHRQHSSTGGSAKKIQRKLKRDCSILLKALRKLPRLQRSERLFSLWHVVHLPVFGMTILTAITHVVAVHMY